MGGKCTKVRSKSNPPKILGQVSSDRVYPDEVLLKYREIKSLHPKNPALSLRTEFWDQISVSECSTPRWNSISLT